MSESSMGPQLIVMLTRDDMTVENAEEVFEECKDSDALYWGMKEKPLPVETMKRLYARMKECGKTTILEVVTYDEAGALQGARLAVECGCDILMGTKYSNTVAEFLHKHNIRYMPFVGEAVGRPSVLRGSVEDILAEAKEAVDRGADGVDLLGYRHTDNPVLLNKTICSKLDAPVCIAGSIDSNERLDEVAEAGAACFTIGSAFFNGKFGGSIPNQINKVCAHIAGK